METTFCDHKLNAVKVTVDGDTLYTSAVYDGNPERDDLERVGGDMADLYRDINPTTDIRVQPFHRHTPTCDVSTHTVCAWCDHGATIARGTLDARCAAHDAQWFTDGQTTTDTPESVHRGWYGHQSVKGPL